MNALSPIKMIRELKLRGNWSFYSLNTKERVMMIKEEMGRCLNKNKCN
jgi:hypothetical protein